MEKPDPEKRVPVTLMIHPRLRRLVRRMAAESLESQSDIVNEALAEMFRHELSAQQSSTQ